MKARVPRGSGAHPSSRGGDPGRALLSQAAQHQGSLRGAEAKNNDIISGRSVGLEDIADRSARRGLALFVNFKMQQEGPVVLEAPAAVDAGLRGTLVDAWQVPLG